MQSPYLAKTTARCLLAGFALAWLWLAPANGLRAQQPPMNPTPAPDFLLKDLAGKDVKLSDFDGKSLLVVFCVTWSKPCQQEFKSLGELQQQYGGKEFTVLGISLDDKGPDSVKSFVDTQKINFPMVMGDYKVVMDFGGLQAVPTTFVIEKNHNIIQRYVGIAEKSTLENDLKSMLR
jgi:cytochrome c biogenesis protein CcmG/thiol:disulfide interchange protein DsbE